ncbi:MULTISPECIES: hypothetical protein [unclassified Helicobacter]|nr:MULTISPECIES: hypothetical protein [unclassified Helicobacter]
MESQNLRIQVAESKEPALYGIFCEIFRIRAFGFQLLDSARFCAL